jgi:exodeoxyribonuclease VII small subunit
MATTGRGQLDGGFTGGAEDVSQLSYSNAGAELDAIIEEFESGVVDVDRLVDQLERATDIVDELDRRLRRTRMRVEELVPRLEAIGQTETAIAGTHDDDEIEFVESGEETPVEESPVPGDGETPAGLF